jgi:uncharacterized protein YqeY
MDLKSTLQSDLKDAMRSGDETRKNTIRMALSAIKLMEIEKGSQLDEAGNTAVIQKEVKSRRDTIKDAERANRPDLISQAEAEIKVLEDYLPEGLTPEELETMAKEAISETGATSLQDMKQIMKILLPRVQNRATGDQVSQVVRKLLQ